MEMRSTGPHLSALQVAFGRVPNAGTRQITQCRQVSLFNTISMRHMGQHPSFVGHADMARFFAGLKATSYAR